MTGTCLYTRGSPVTVVACLNLIGVELVRLPRTADSNVEACVLTGLNPFDDAAALEMAVRNSLMDTKGDGGAMGLPATSEFAGSGSSSSSSDPFPPQWRRRPDPSAMRPPPSTIDLLTSPPGSPRSREGRQAGTPSTLPTVDEHDILGDLYY